MSDQRQVYEDLKHRHRAATRTTESRLRSQETTITGHFSEQMKALDRQFKETERKRRAQQAMLRQRYKLQQQQMKQRQIELLKIKDKLHDLSDREHHQVQVEAKLGQRYQRVQAIKTDFENREERSKANRDLLVGRKNDIVREMQELEALTGQLDQLNLGADMENQTEEQKQQMDNYVAQYPDEYRFDDREYSSRRVRNRYSAFDDEESDFKEYSAPRRSHKRSERRNSRHVRRTERKSKSSKTGRRRSKKRISLKMTIADAPRNSDSVRRSATRSVRSTDSRSERRSRRSSKSVSRRSANRRSVSRRSQRSTRPRRSSRSQARASRYESKSGNLYVRLVNARGVFGSKGSMPNTYVEMECDGQVQESSMIRGGDSVRGDECFKFAIENYDESMLTIRLIDADIDETIAKVRIPTVEFVQMADSGDLDTDHPVNDEASAPPLLKMGTISKIKNRLSRKSSSKRSKRKQSR